jgi:hypothetical protein
MHKTGWVFICFNREKLIQRVKPGFFTPRSDVISKNPYLYSSFMSFQQSIRYLLKFELVKSGIDTLLSFLNQTDKMSIE